MTDKIERLQEYAEDDCTEVGEFNSLISQLARYSDYMSKELYNELMKEIDDSLHYYDLETKVNAIQPEVESILQFTPHEGDVFVLTCKDRLSTSHREIISKSWKEIIPNNKLIVLDNGMKLEVIQGVGSK